MQNALDITKSGTVKRKSKQKTSIAQISKNRTQPYSTSYTHPKKSYERIGENHEKDNYLTTQAKKPSQEHRPSTNFHLEIEEKQSNDFPETPLTWPNHMLVFGATQAGKTQLIANLLDNIEKVYNLKDCQIKERKRVVISPIPDLEIANYMATKHFWDMELYNDLDFNEEFENHLKNCFQNTSSNNINILLLDDILTHTRPNQIIFLNKWFSYFRHINVSIIATIHSYDIKFSTIIDQSGMIVAMYCLNTSNVLRNILARYLYKGSAKVWGEIRRIFLSMLKKHDYICMNFSKEALSSDVFFITTTLFKAKRGLKLHQIVSKI